MATPSLRIMALASCILTGIMPLSAAAQTAAEIFERTFGKPAPTVERILPVPLVIEGQFRGDIDITIGSDPDKMRVGGHTFIDAVSGILTDDANSALRRALTPDEMLFINDIRSAGLTAEFDVTRVELTVTLPVAVRRLQSVQLRRSQAPPAAERALGPSRVAGFVNARSAMSYVQQADSGVDSGRQPNRLDLDGAVNWDRTVFEWLATYQEGAARPWQRSDVSVSRDDIDRRWRYSVGDLAYPLAGLQSFVPLGGLSMSKSFDIQPHRVTQPGGEASFTLQQPSQVEVFVNDRPVRTLQLPAGPHNVRDFPFSSGANDVRLRITDDVGRVEVVNFPFFFDARLLAPGEDQFAYSVGLPSRTQGGLRKYNRGRPTLSVFHRVGISESLTSGATFQADRKTVVGGGEAIWATTVGNFLADIAVSSNDIGLVDMAARLRYRYSSSRPKNRAGQSFQMALSYRGDDFATVGSNTINNPIAVDLSARYGRRIFLDTTVGIGGTYQFGRNARADSNSANLFFNRSLGGGISGTLRLERREDSTGTISQTALLTVSVPLGQNRQNVDYSRDTGSQTSRLNWRYMPPQQIGAVSGSVSFNRSQRTETVGGDLKYTGTRGQVEVSQDVAQTRSPAPGDNTDVRSRFRASSALVFADGGLGIGRTVSNSFVLLSPHPALKGQRVGVNPSGDRYTAQIDHLGPAVLPNVTPYRVSRVLIDAPELPDGLDLGDQVIDILPTHRSGIRLIVGTGATVFIVGTLQTVDRLPVSLQAGRLHNLDDPNIEPFVLITNRRGRFIVEGLAPGRYALRMLVAPDTDIPIDIPDNARGRYDLGPVNLPTDTPAQNPDTGATP